MSRPHVLQPSPLATGEARLAGTVAGLSSRERLTPQEYSGEERTSTLSRP